MKISEIGINNLKNEDFWQFMIKDLKIDKEYIKESTMDFFGFTMNFYKYNDCIIIMTLQLDDDEVLWDRFGIKSESYYEQVKEHLELTKKELLYNFISFHDSINNNESWEYEEGEQYIIKPDTNTGLFGLTMKSIDMKDIKSIEDLKEFLSDKE